MCVETSTTLKTTSSSTIIMITLLHGKWGNDESSRPFSLSHQQSSFLSISSSLHDSITQLSNKIEENDEDVEKTYLECSASSIEEKIQMQFVETRLLDLVFQQDGEANLNTHPYLGHDHPFLESPKSSASENRPPEYACVDLDSVLPSPPTNWPQSPIMLRPTPNKEMKIHGVRYANSASYHHFPGACASHILPINTGFELPGQSLVIDFESPLFIGSFSIQVKGVSPFNSPNSAAEKQFTPPATFPVTSTRTATLTDATKVVVKGRFKQENIPMSDCVTGQVFDRPAGKLPAKIVVNTFVKLISTLAPQLEVELDGDCPRFLSPLVATAHTVITKDYSTVNSARNTSFIATPATASMEDDLEEPSSNDSSSIMTALPSKMKVSLGNQRTILQRRAARKKTFNRLAANRSAEPTFNVNKEYVFEFYQDLLLLTEPDDFKIDMGHNIRVGLSRSLNGQPIKILAARKSCSSIDSNEDKSSSSGIAQVLWSFDLWHEALYPLAASSQQRLE